MTSVAADGTCFRKTWQAHAVLLTILLLLAAFPVFREWLRTVDTSISYYFNGFLGHNRTIDLLIARFNSGRGDKVLIVCFATFVLLHSYTQGNRDETSRRLAFWTWTITTFTLLLPVQYLLEHTASRPSPGLELKQWFSLKTTYQIKTRVTSMHSFPSGHATMFFFICCLAVRRYRTAGTVLLAIFTVIPVTRLMSGAHWASDVYLGSLPVAAFFAALFIETPLYRSLSWFEGLFRLLLRSPASDSATSPHA